MHRRLDQHGYLPSLRRVAVDAIEVLNLLRVRLVASSALVSAGPGVGRGRFEGDKVGGCCSCDARHRGAKQVASTEHRREPLLHSEPSISVNLPSIKRKLSRHFIWLTWLAVPIK